MTQPLTLAVIGDSAASGVGDSDSNGNHFGWGYHLAQAFNEPLIYINAARPGARSGEVLEEQLVKVSVHDPELVAVVVGGNDLLRSNFSPTVFESNLRETLIRLVSTGATVMLLELHDPTKIVPMPYLVGRICRRRVAAVNKATSKMAQDFGAIMLPTRSLENIYSRSKWHVDRMHPSKLGHQFIASEFAKMLRDRGFDVGDVAISPVNNRSRKDSILWMLRNGTPWFAKRSIDLFPGLIWLSMAEIVYLLRSRFARTSNPLTQIQVVQSKAPVRTLVSH
jgi:lysophospholipase L1-like esterase